MQKKRGRPSRKIDKCFIPIEGIVTTPSNIELENSQPLQVFILEIVYSNPTMFKKIFSLFKSIQADVIRFRTEKDHFKLYALEHRGSSKIYVKISGDKMNRYYCEKTIEVTIDTNVINKVLQTISKDDGCIIFQINRKNERSRLTILSNHEETEEQSEYNIDLGEPKEYDWDIEEELSWEKEYPITFCLPFKHFKKKINDVRLLANILRIEGEGDNLHLSCTFANSKGSYNTYFTNPSRIELESKLEKDKMFSTAVLLEYIKPLVSSIIADKIYISADPIRNLIISIYLDDIKDAVCEIKIVTNVVRVEED